LVEEVHEVTEIVNACTGNEIVSLSEVQSTDQVLQQTGIHFVVIHESNRLSLAPAAEALFNSLDDVCRYIIIYVDLGIAGHLKDVRLVLVVIEEEEYFRQAKPYDVFQENDVLLAVGGRQQ